MRTLKIIYSSFQVLNVLHYKNSFVSDSKAKNRVSGFILIENLFAHSVSPNRVSGCILKYYAVNLKIWQCATTPWLLCLYS